MFGIFEKELIDKKVSSENSAKIIRQAYFMLKKNKL